MKDREKSYYQDQQLVEKSKLIVKLDVEQHLSDRLNDAAEMLWVVLANVNGGDWKKQTEEWQKVAVKWRDSYFMTLKEHRKIREKV